MTAVNFPLSLGRLYCYPDKHIEHYGEGTNKFLRGGKSKAIFDTTKVLEVVKLEKTSHTPNWPKLAGYPWNIILKMNLSGSTLKNSPKSLYIM